MLRWSHFSSLPEKHAPKDVFAFGNVTCSALVPSILFPPLWNMSCLSDNSLRQFRCTHNLYFCLSAHEKVSQWPFSGSSTAVNGQKWNRGSPKMHHTSIMASNEGVLVAPDSLACRSTQGAAPYMLEKWHPLLVVSLPFVWDTKTLGAPAEMRFPASSGSFVIIEGTLWESVCVFVFLHWTYAIAYMSALHHDKH